MSRRGPDEEMTKRNRKPARRKHATGTDGYAFGSETADSSRDGLDVLIVMAAGDEAGMAAYRTKDEAEGRERHSFTKYSHAVNQVRIGRGYIPQTGPHLKRREGRVSLHGTPNACRLQESPRKKNAAEKADAKPFG